MMTLEEFRESFINEDINAEAISTSRHPVEIFIDECKDILINDYSLLSEINDCYFEFKNGTKAFKNMSLDAAYLDLETNVLNLMIVDYNPGEVTNITNEFINRKTNLLINYFENVLKGFFKDGEQANPAVQLSRDIINNRQYIYKLHLFIVSTNKLSKVVKTLKMSDYTFAGQTFKVELDVLDIEKIYLSKKPGFQKDDLIIDTKDYGFKGIPCIKAEIETDQYESYLAIVPGEFLSDIYKEHSDALLSANVRSFLKFNGAVNKGIRGTILNEKHRFFTYNNGISTTASDVVLEKDPNGGLILTSFTNLQIINGGQTTATLAATNIKNGADLSGIYVQMKLTVVKDVDDDFVINIAKYANCQNQIKDADLNSSHKFYVRMEDYSRKIYAPLQTGQIVQELWYFERIRGQYDQPLMQMTKGERDNYKKVRPKNKKFNLTDLSKYLNAADMLPYFVSWGGQVNARRFHTNMVAQWEKDDSVYNELFYKELIGKKILFTHIGNLVSNQSWYQENRAYRPQIIAYTFSKLVYEAKKENLSIDYKKIWDLQKVPECLDNDLIDISKIVFDCIHNENTRTSANIETYCKKEDCWKHIQKQPYDISDLAKLALISKLDKEIEITVAKKEQSFNSGLADEISIFKQGSPYWNSLLVRGKEQEVINYSDEKLLKVVINYCNGVYAQLTKSQIKQLELVTKKLQENGIE